MKNTILILSKNLIKYRWIAFIGLFFIGFMTLAIIESGSNWKYHPINAPVNPQKPISSAYFTVPWIYIDDNWSEAAAEFEYVNGVGTWADPYVIENITILGISSLGNAITIKHSSSDKYYVIRNCYLSNASLGSKNNDAGILLDQCENVRIENSTFENNKRIGIRLISCQNSTIYNNTFSNVSGMQQDYGIYSSNSNWTMILNNTFSSLNDYGVYISNSGTNNTISNNSVRDIPLHGICSLAENTTIQQNDIQNCDEAISVSSSNFMSLQNNRIKGSDIGINIEYSANNLTVQANDIENSSIGMQISSSQNNIYQNTIWNCTNFGIIIGIDSKYNSIFQNQITLGNGGIDNYGPNNTIGENLIRNITSTGLGVKIAITGENTTLISNTVQDLYNGVLINANKCIIQYNTFASISQTALNLTSSAMNSEISSNLFANGTTSSSYGIYENQTFQNVFSNNTVDNYYFGIYSNNVTECFYLNNSLSTITYSAFTTIYGQNNIINNNTIRKANYLGISSSNSKNCTIQKNTFLNDSGYNAIGISASGDENITIRENSIFNYRTGISSINCYAVFIRNNTILGQTNQNLGIYCSSSLNITVDGNFINRSIYASYAYGGYFFQCTFLNLTYNIFSYNNNNPNGYGAYVWYCSNTTVQNNTFNDNFYGLYIRNMNYHLIENNSFFSNFNLGLCSDSSNYGQIKNNTFFTIGKQQNHGIYLSVSSTFNIIANNSIFDNYMNGILTDISSSNNTFVNNSIRNQYTSQQDYGISCGSPGNNFINNTFEANTGGLAISRGFNLISGNIFKNNNQYGIYSTASGNNIIVNNIFDANLNGIIVSGGFNIISGNVLKNNNQYGIQSSGTGNNYIFNNTFDTNFGGIYITNGENFISCNEIKNSLQNGIYLFTSAAIKGNCIIQNIFQDNGASGIYAQTGGSYNIIEGNLFEHISYQNFGLYFQQMYNSTIQNNVFRNMSYGIFLKTSLNITISDNLFEWSTDMGLDIESSNETMIINNTILYSTNFGLRLRISSNQNNVINNTFSHNPNTIYGSNSTQNLIYGNIIYNSTVGIKMELSSNNNIFYLNNLTLCTQAVVDDCKNQWDDGLVGNYYSAAIIYDYNLDGIGDIPYFLGGIGGNYDNHPLTTGPYVLYSPPQNITYEIGTTNHVLYWTLYELSPCYRYYEIKKDGILISSATLVFKNISLSINIDYLSLGTHTVELSVYRGSGTKFSSLITIDVRNSVPILVAMPSDVTIENSLTDANLTWIISDISVNSGTYCIKVNGIYKILNQPVGDESIISFLLPIKDVGIYMIEFQFNDGYGGICSDLVQIIVNNTLPIFSDVPIDNSILMNESTIISWTFIDQSVANPTYTLLQNGVPIISDEKCNVDIGISFIVQNLTTGTYIFTLIVQDGFGGSRSDSVIVNVNAISTPTDSQINQVPETDSSSVVDLILNSNLGIIGAVIVMGLISGLNNRTRPKSPIGISTLNDQVIKKD